jgi:hypothetical protein
MSGSDLLMMMSSRLTVIGVMATVGWLLGLLARSSLRVTIAQRKTERDVVRNWMLGGVAIALVMLTADSVLHWRDAGINLDANSAEIVGYVIGSVGGGAVIGFIVALVSRAGLRRAVRDANELLLEVGEKTPHP